MWMADGTTSDYLVYLFGCYVFYWGGGNGDSLRWRILWKKSVDYLSLLSYREEIANESQNEWYEEIVNELPPNIIRSARFWIDSILSASSAVRPVCQTDAAYSITGHII